MIRPATQRNKKLQKLTSKKKTNFNFLDNSAYNNQTEIYSSTRDNKTLYDIYSNTAKSNRFNNNFNSKKKAKIMFEKQKMESRRMYIFYIYNNIKVKN